MEKLAVFGASGFIGSSAVAGARAMGVHCVGLRAPRIAPMASDTADDATVEWRKANPQAFEELTLALESFDSVINAAGLAAPASADRQALFGANVLLPAVIAQAAKAAGVRRMVHVSTAAVQGRMNRLDETATWFPLTPYAESKVEAERFLLGAGDRLVPPELVVYRPTSVHGPERAVTRNLIRMMAALPVAIVGGQGDQPLPVALVENVAAGLVFAATTAEMAPIVLQPWEGLTPRVLFGLFSKRRVVSVPEWVLNFSLRSTARATSGLPSVVARLRHVELLLRGQCVDARHLKRNGFRAPVGREGWLRLAADGSAAGEQAE